MTGHEIRQKFLDYFAGRGHRVVRSSPLLPANDPTLLFTNAGMNQFKDVFLGLEPRDYKRAASSQKCVRAGGKHNDLDEVGRTARHHTFFEMLGNFSFGDYFKKEAVYFAWDLLVNELGLDPERLWFSVFEGDDEVGPDEEAVRCWQQVGARPERILRFGRKDNFWQMGETGPCGPCSEIHYYIGEHPEDPEFNRVEYVNGPGDTTMEIWNLVFMQFNRSQLQDGSYKLDALPAPSVDTGAGLERLAAVLQGVDSNYETDLIRPIIDFTAAMLGKPYNYDDTEDSVSMRVIADHARATAFLIADGVFPGNEGRSYVLRKIMRRAIWHGNRLGLKEQFFSNTTGFVVELMGDVYPELVGSRNLIEKIASLEERRFGSTLASGLKRLDELLSSGQHKDSSKVIVSTSELVRLYDTFGTPIDLMYLVLTRSKCSLQIPIEFPGDSTRRYLIEPIENVSEEDFRTGIERSVKKLQQQKSEARPVEHKKAKPVYVAVSRRRDTKTEFRGYETTVVDNAKVVALIKDDGLVQTLSKNDQGEVVLDQTPFYAESGGQVGDVGLLTSETGSALVEDTYSPLHDLVVHRVRILGGSVGVGDLVLARVDDEKRQATRRNHTGTHLLHAALREVLGPHVKQAGSLVAPDRLRFDFTHYAPLTGDEIAEIERLVNSEILHNREVETQIKPLEEALQSGAMALFGEKYASDVRVVSVPGFSTELCGGTHVSATGDIGPMKIIGDSSIAAGVRRIEALTADAAIARFQVDEHVIEELAERFKVPSRDIPAHVDKLLEQVRRYEREIEQLKLKMAQTESASAADNAREIAGVRVVARRVANLDANGMRQLADSLSQKLKSGVVVLGQATDGKASLVARVTDDLTKRLNAGQIVKEISALVGGKGGGRPDMATGGGNEPEKLEAALEASYKTVERMLDTN